jgi:hypothetical protein
MKIVYENARSSITLGACTCICFSSRQVKPLQVNELFIVQQKKNLGLEDDSFFSMAIGGLVLILWEVFD